MMIRNRILERVQRHARLSPADRCGTVRDTVTGLLVMAALLIGGAFGVLSVAVQIAKVM